MLKALLAKLKKSLFKASELAATYSSMPPPLAVNFDLGAYREFMCAETHFYCEDYIRNRIKIKGQENYESALQNGSVVVVFMHHGSWLLMNGALHHLCGTAHITSIASRRNLEFCTSEEKEFWLGVHKRAGESCNAPVIFYTDQNPIASVRWLKQPHHVLTVALDVREPAVEKPESQFKFMGQNIYLQTGPAKLAKITKASIVPAAIVYDLVSKTHTMTLYPSIKSGDFTLEELTQKALSCIEVHVEQSKSQQFYDLVGALQKPHNM